MPAHRVAPVGIAVNRARRLAAQVSRTFPGADLALWAAGATYFGVIGLVPLAMVALWAAGALVGHDAVRSSMEAAIAGLPSGHGTPEALRTLTAVALAMPWWQALVVLFPASLYGEGLRRAFVQLTPETDKLTGWRGRAGLLGVAAVAPFLVLAVLASAPYVAPLYTGTGWSLAWGVFVGFHVVWIAVSTALVGVYGLIAPGRFGITSLVAGAFGTGAILAGFLQGFLLFLAIPIEWSAPFGGMPVIGAVSALALWLYLVHILVLCGFRVTVVLHGVFAARAGRSLSNSVTGQ
ncbi:YhjD/YihY/BrkB family envelope integrity protein [Mycolicibacterium bacteremicum]|uniref:YhjD/YihY/BrkB family envelope integrity protein n=1 Tax=Mycolicibacterium bacteremicum TaxID=564198 RepID=UPI0026F23F39|nr:YhjD/YihY/BrkB family envelope integrity protein [Mycolicibacterium bacteremicum]